LNKGESCQLAESFRGHPARKKYMRELHQQLVECGGAGQRGGLKSATFPRRECLGGGHLRVKSRPEPSISTFRTRQKIQVDRHLAMLTHIASAAQRQF